MIINNSNNRIQMLNSRFLTISSLRRKLSPTRTLKWPGRNRVQITCNTSSAYHAKHVVLRATWYEGTAPAISLAELKSHLFSSLLLAEPLATSFRKCHILKPEDSSPKRDSKPYNNIAWRQARKADVLTVTPRVAPS